MQAPALDDSTARAGIYIHIPYCLAKCAYCSFVSKPIAPGSDFGPYIDAIIKHAHLLAERQPTAIYDSIFIGGGTPTIIPAALLANMLDNIRDLYDFSGKPEISMEANPNTLNARNLAALRATGVNRLSIGVQSFTDTMLKAIGRTHTAREAIAAFKLARAAGFTNINLDLIYGLPDQSAEDWQHSLATALGLSPDHISVYELMVEAPSIFASRMADNRLHLPDIDAMLIMDEVTAQETAQHGFIRYEISNYARNNHVCRHNINYWQNGSYIGLGAAAVSNFNGIRLTNSTEPETYIQSIKAGALPFTHGEILARAPSFRESIIMGLRMVSGVDLAGLKARYDIWAPDYYGKTLDDLIAGGLIRQRDKYLQLTGIGLRLANRVMAELV